MNNTSRWSNPWSTLGSAIAVPPIITTVLLGIFIIVEWFVLSPLFGSSVLTDFSGILLNAIIAPNLFIALFWFYLFFGSLFIAAAPGGQSPDEYNKEVMTGFWRIILSINVIHLLLMLSVFTLTRIYGTLDVNVIALLIAGSMLIGFVASLLGDPSTGLRITGYGLGGLVIVLALMSMLVGGLFDATLQGASDLSTATPDDLRTNHWNVYINLLMIIGLFGGLYLVFSKKSISVGLVLVCATIFAWLRKPEILTLIKEHSEIATIAIIAIVALVALSQVSGGVIWKAALVAILVFLGWTAWEKRMSISEISKVPLETDWEVIFSGNAKPQPQGTSTRRLSAGEYIISLPRANACGYTYTSKTRAEGRWAKITSCPNGQMVRINGEPRYYPSDLDQGSEYPNQEVYAHSLYLNVGSHTVTSDNMTESITLTQPAMVTFHINSIGGMVNDTTILVVIEKKKSP